MTLGRMLGLDIGERRIGVAVSDELGTLASPVGMILRQRDVATEVRGWPLLISLYTLALAGLLVSALQWVAKIFGRSDAAQLDEVEQEVRSLIDQSVALSKELRRRGFAFVGPTTMQALMEAIGIVDTHLVGSHRRGVSGLWKPDGTRA